MFMHYFKDGSIGQFSPYLWCASMGHLIRNCNLCPGCEGYRSRLAALLRVLFLFIRIKHALLISIRRRLYNRITLNHLDL